jgi:hypothetical protein
MAAQTASSPGMRPKIYVDCERRRTRSVDPEIALQMQLQTVLEAHDVDLIVIADLDGAAVATAGDGDSAMDLAQFAAAVAKEHPTWESMVTSQGFVVVQRVEIGLRTWVVAAQARYSLPDRAGIARAVMGTMRIVREGLAVEAAIPLVQLGGWGDWYENPSERPVVIVLRGRDGARLRVRDCACATRRGRSGVRDRACTAPRTPDDSR